MNKEDIYNKYFSGCGTTMEFTEAGEVEGDIDITDMPVIQGSGMDKYVSYTKVIWEILDEILSLYENNTRKRSFMSYRIAEAILQQMEEVKDEPYPGSLRG